MHTVNRLIQSFIPTAYHLSLTLEREARRFAGTVTIHGETPSDSTSITLHAKDLTIESATIDGKSATPSQGENDELALAHPDIAAGKHIVTIAFHGTITDAMHGLYPCYYEHEGVKKELLATQFESHHAREVFPCIDEPEAKATFDVTLTTEPNITVLGNMPVKAQHAEGGDLVTTFDATPRMSTYLLAWVTGELQCKTATTKNGVEVGIWATPAQPANSLEFALQTATNTIDFFDQYFDTPYPLPKSDHVALPDFSAGAMENWGLVTYRESALLAGADTSIAARRHIALVIAHELSHQWFGNLVTMKWWNNLWLNESFATLMEYIAIDALYPDWQIWLDFATHESILALRRDSIDGVQPVQTDVNHPDEIGTLFDGAIVYAKGARLLHMLQQYVGETSFQAGLKSYFAKHAYSNTEGDDLWRELSETSGQNIAGFMNAWISQPGYPVVSVDQHGDTLQLRQQQFFVGPHQPSQRLWPIPLNTKAEFLPAVFNAKDLSIPHPTNTPVRLNHTDSAHFITHYSPELRAQLLATIATANSEPLQRLQLLHEQLLLARGGLLASDQLIPLLETYRHETSEPVWDMISLTAKELKKFTVDDEPSLQQLRKLAANLAREQYQRLGWEPQVNEAESDGKLRATIIGLMLFGEDSEAMTEALQRYRTAPLEELSPDLRHLIISTAVRHGNDPTIVDDLLNRYPRIASPDISSDVAAGLAATKDEVVVQRLLASMKDPHVVRPQNVLRWFAQLIRNHNGRATAWAWLQANWQWVEDTFAGDKYYDAFPRVAAANLMTTDEAHQYKAFFAPMQAKPALTRVVAMGISELEGRMELIDKDAAAVRAALAKL